MSKRTLVECRVEKLTIPTYPEPAKERLPMYCENRVHQRTSGKVYPNAIVNEVIRDRKEEKDYTAIVLDNSLVEVILLPELGGRVFAAKDKSNGYDFFYRQHVIKPALIGLLGSWVSGGAEFNWPLHHRPSTFMPVDFDIERQPDGSVTVWLSEHEPLDRMKGMVGIRMEPGKAMFETVVKVFNRTPVSQSFLWWENIAVPVNKDYQIFFPKDVHNVYFHYKKSVTQYPVPRSMFNGIDYRNNEGDIRWHKNTVHSTSYFSARSNFDFFGGYDHGKKAGVVHIANHHISPGKKLFTWAYNQLSRSWERALTDTDGAYAELMAGSYTDNQPDFAWLEPFEEKEFSQYWIPYKDIGEPDNANIHAAFNHCFDNGRLLVRVYAVRALEGASVNVVVGDEVLHSTPLDLLAGKSTEIAFALDGSIAEEELTFRVLERDGSEIIAYQKPLIAGEQAPAEARQIPAPDQLHDADTLFLTGLHLRQYRDPLVHPEVYWKRALELNPAHASSANALGLSALQDGRFEEAVRWLQSAVSAQTQYNPNPRDGEAFFNLGLALKFLGRLEEAYTAFYKAIWNYAWRSAGYFALAQIDSIRKDYGTARKHLFLSLQTNTKNHRAHHLLAAVERHLGNPAGALAAAENILKNDKLNYAAMSERMLAGGAPEAMFGPMNSDPSQTLLDIVFEYTGAGLFDDAALLISHFASYFGGRQISPMVYFALEWALAETGRDADAARALAQAEAQSPDYCFPSRLEELVLLQSVLARRSSARASYYLGNLLYGKRQYDAAIRAWEEAAVRGETYYVLLRNLGMAYYNNRRDAALALQFVRKALEAEPGSPQLVFELNYLMQRTNQPFGDRIKLLEAHRAAVGKRDDLYMEWVRVHHQTGAYEKAIELLGSRDFTPCEGGEHELAELWIYAHFCLGRLAMQAGAFRKAADYFRTAQVLPDHLGAGIWNESFNVPSAYYEGCCLARMDEAGQARTIYEKLVNMGRDFFTTMYQPAMDYYLALAHRALGDHEASRCLLQSSLAQWQAEREKPDHGYFKATPFFLSYLENPADVRHQHYDYLIGLAHLGLGDAEAARRAFAQVLELNSGHLWALIEMRMLAGAVG